MFSNVKNIYVLLIGNSLKSCKNDIDIVEKLLKDDAIFIQKYKDVNILKTLSIFFKDLILNKDDLLIIHYSGHGEMLGKKINGKIDIISTWKNMDGTHVYSSNIDKILSKLDCHIFLLSDSCHSGYFGKYFIGKSPFLFIGSSKGVFPSTQYRKKHTNVYFGALTYIMEYIINNNKFKSINLNEFINLSNKMFRKYKFKSLPVIKSFNIKDKCV